MIYMCVVFPSNVNAQEDTSNILKISAEPRFYINYNQGLPQSFSTKTSFFKFNRFIPIDTIPIMVIKADTFIVNSHEIKMIPAYNLSFGIMLDFHVARSSVLNFGIGFKALKYKLNEMRTTELQTPAVNDPRQISGNLFSEFTPTISSFRTQYLSVPFAIKSKLSKRFGVNGGIIANFLLKGKSDQRRLIINSTMDYNKVESTHLFKATFNELSAGIYFIVNQNVDIELHFRTPLGNMFSGLDSSPFFGISVHKPSSIGLTFSSTLSTSPSTQDKNIRRSKTRKNE